MEGIQRRATKFILGSPSASLPYNERLLKLNLLPVSYWHELKDLVFFFKAVNGHYNIDITKFIQPKVIVRSTRNSSSLDYLISKCKTSTFQESYFIRTVKLWNSLPSSTCTRSLPTATAFKTALYNHYRCALVTTFNPENNSTLEICMLQISLYS